jgi:GNAT superfamily N-acetyltransferase
METVVEAEVPSRAELASLYDSVGWTAYTNDLDSLERGVHGSLRVVTARVSGRLAGLARVVGDGATIVYLQDVLVAPAYRREGIGRQLVEAAFEPYRQVRQHVLLTDDEPAQRAFYESLGFTETRDYRSGALRAYVRFH